MPSIFDSFFADGRAHLQQQHGTAVIWTKPSGAAIPIVALPGPESSDARDTEHGGLVIFPIRTIEIPLSLVPDPNRGDTCTIDGVVWGYDLTLATQAGLAQVQLVRPGQAEITHQGYRGGV